MQDIIIQQTDLWYVIKKFVDEMILYRNWKYRTKHRKFAKTYYFKDQALSWLMIARKCEESDL